MKSKCNVYFKNKIQCSKKLKKLFTKLAISLNWYHVDVVCKIIIESPVMRKCLMGKSDLGLTTLSDPKYFATTKRLLYLTGRIG